MPVYTLSCPDCGHRYHGMVLAGAQLPRIWECSGCGGKRAAVDPRVAPVVHPWERQGHGAGCLCCGPPVSNKDDKERG